MSSVFVVCKLFCDDTELLAAFSSNESALEFINNIERDKYDDFDIIEVPLDDKLVYYRFSVGISGGSIDKVTNHGVAISSIFEVRNGNTYTVANISAPDENAAREIAMREVIQKIGGRV